MFYEKDAAGQHLQKSRGANSNVVSAEKNLNLPTF